MDIYRENLSFINNPLVLLRTPDEYRFDNNLFGIDITANGFWISENVAVIAVINSFGIGGETY